jgi:triacylglycerol lipase
MRAFSFAICISLFVATFAAQADEPTKPQVVLLHGLARSAASMDRMGKALTAAGFEVCNVAYPSRRHTIAELTENFVAPKISECFSDPQQPIHFVTHSLGGIVARQLAFAGLIEKFGRVVMLSPPNQGTEVVDKLGNLALFSAVSGLAGRELGTSTDALPAQLGKPPFEFGIITGTRSINLFLSLMIPGPDDGKVSVKRAKLDGMKDFLAMPVTHPFIMINEKVIDQTIHFLRYGIFAYQGENFSEGQRGIFILGSHRLPV